MSGQKFILLFNSVLLYFYLCQRDKPIKTEYLSAIWSACIGLYGLGYLPCLLGIKSLTSFVTLPFGSLLTSHLMSLEREGGACSHQLEL